jgi:Uma2 family endonuclease
VREYWVIDPDNKILHAHRFEDAHILTRFYAKTDTAPVTIFDGLEIAMEPVFAG